MKNSFKKKFRADSWEGLSSEDILKKTQAPEAEMRAAMGLVDEYGRGGWELGKKYYYEAGKDVEFDAINLDRGDNC